MDDKHVADCIRSLIMYNEAIIKDTSSNVKAEYEATVKDRDLIIPPVSSDQAPSPPIVSRYDNRFFAGRELEAESTQLQNDLALDDQIIPKVRAYINSQYQFCIYLGGAEVIRNNKVHDWTIVNRMMITLLDCNENTMAKFMSWSEQMPCSQFKSTKDPYFLLFTT